MIVQPNEAAPYLETVLREMSERESVEPFEWEFTETWDDGYGLGRVIVIPHGAVWSEARQSWVTRSFSVGFAVAGKPLNTDGRRPSVPRFHDQPGNSRPESFHPTSWVGVVMKHLGGRNPRRFDNGWTMFDATLPDEAPGAAG
jgi:hypothetical protein